MVALRRITVGVGKMDRGVDTELGVGSGGGGSIWGSFAWMVRKPGGVGSGTTLRIPSTSSSGGSGGTVVVPYWTKRRRLVMYVVAFMVMFGMSANLEGRKKNGTRLRPKQLVLDTSLFPGNSEGRSTEKNKNGTTVGDGVGSSVGVGLAAMNSARETLQVVAAAVEWPATGTEAVPTAVASAATENGSIGVSGDPRSQDAVRQTAAVKRTDETVTEDSAVQNADTTLSDASRKKIPDHDAVDKQDLTEEVSQFIEHVEMEDQKSGQFTINNIVNGEGNSANTDSSLRTADVGAKSESSDTAGSRVRNEESTTRQEGPSSSHGGGSLDDQFQQARERVQSQAASLAEVAGEAEYLAMQAMALQISHGDCERTSDDEEHKSLFKTATESEADEVERTSPLWGAWCILRGRNRLDLMKEYLAKEEYLQAQRRRALESHERELANVPAVPVVEADNNTFAARNETIHQEGKTGTEQEDSEAFGVEEIEAELLEPRTRVKELERENLVGDLEARYMEALYLQTLKGSCSRDKSKFELESLSVKRDTALWGAWCMFHDLSQEDAKVEYLRREGYLRDLKRKMDEDSKHAEAVAR